MFFAALPLRAFWESGCTARAMRGMSRLAQLVERKTLNLVVVGSSPTVGAPFYFYFFQDEPFRAPAATPRISSGSSVGRAWAVSYTHLRAHETRSNLVCRLLLEKRKKR